METTVFITDQEEDFPGAYSLAAFCRTYNVGLTFTYQQIRERKLRAVKAGNRTLILRSDAEAWARSLPEMRAAS